MASTQFADLNSSVSVRAASRYSPDDLISSATLREMLGGISDMTLWRWTKHLAFPSPDFMLSRRKFWRHSTVQMWLSAQARPPADAE
jgi:predicted DNA-binding transcriptional regulator AlpA